MRLNPEKINQFRKFIKDLDDDSRIAVIYDTDMDGISSGIITIKALKKLKKNVIYYRTRSPGSRNITKDLLEDFEKTKVSHIIFTDLGIESYDDSDLLNKYKVMVLDHHPRKDSYNKKILTIKSFDIQNEISGHKYCAAKLVFDLFSLETNIEDLDWLALAGVIGDMTYDANKAWADKILKKYSLDVEENPFDTRIGHLVQYTTYAAAIGTQEEFDRLTETFLKTNNYEDLIKQLDYLNPVKEDFERIIKEFDEKKEYLGKEVFIYEFESEYYLNSPVCSVLSNKYYPDKTIICMQEKNSLMTISARRQDGKYDLGKMLDEITRTLKDAFGGGHPVAAGAKIKIIDKEEFKKKVIDWVKQNG